MWKVRLVFPQAAGGEKSVTLDGVDDTTRIHELFRPYVDTEQEEAKLEDPFLPYRWAMRIVQGRQGCSSMRFRGRKG